MNERIDILYSEILSKCKELSCFEFEYYWEMWGIMWNPWFIEIAGKSITLSIKELTQSDLEHLVDLNRIEVVKIYLQDEMTDEFDRKRYRIKNR